MKKVLVTMMIAVVAATTISAQEIPDRKRGEFRPVEKQRMFNKKTMASLNLTEEQKTRMKSMNQDFRKQMEELKKQDNLTVKVYREKMQTLHKNHRDQFQSILTPEQKVQLEKDKEALKAKKGEYAKKRQARMKEELNLTEEQTAKMTESRKQLSEKMKAIHENASLTPEQKKEQVKELMKKQKENMKSILTEEQLQKMKENRKNHAGKKHGQNS